jgi:hypothetical protein
MTLLITLMHSINPDLTGLSPGLRFDPLTNFGHYRFGVNISLAAIASTVPQIIYLSYGYSGNMGIFRMTIYYILTLQYLLRSRTTKPAM